jgi:porphobilinogen deaminase
MVGSVDGKIQLKRKIRGSKNEPEETGRVLANILLNAGAKEILDEIYGTPHSVL